MDRSQMLESARRVFDKEIIALEKTREALGDDFLDALDLITNCEGRVIITGMGKPGHISKKLAATFSSLGIPAFHLHPAEALHGDLGMITEKDIVLAFSYSGESEEVVRILSTIHMIGAKIIGVSGKKESTLIKQSDIAIIFPAFEEACHLNLAPTSSTTATLALGDALAVVSSEAHGFTDADFALFHPSGALGKKLRFRVEDLMAKGDEIPCIKDTASLPEAINAISKKEQGMVVILDDFNHIAGIITDGDLRRMLEKHIDIYNCDVKDIMNRNPICTTPDVMAVSALQELKKRKINGMPVENNNHELLGIIRLQHILNAGII